MFLNDIFIISGNKYRINTIETNLNSGKTNVELLSIITDEFQPPIVLCPTADSTDVTVDSTLYTVDCGDRLCATADETTVTVDDTDLTVDCGDPIPTTTSTTTLATTTTTLPTTTTIGTTTTTIATTTVPTTTIATTTIATTTIATTTTETPCIQRISYSGIPTQNIEVGENKTINLDNYFTQLDGQPLSYLAIDNTQYLDSVSVSGNQLTMFANSGNLCGTDGSGVYVQAYDSISGNCEYGTYFGIDVFGCTVETTTTLATTTLPTTTTTEGTTTTQATTTTTQGTTTTTQATTTTTIATTTTLATTTTTTIAPVNPTGTINNTFVGYNNTGANFDVFTNDAVNTYIDFTIYPIVGSSYSERQVVPTVNGTLVNWSISWNGDIDVKKGGTGTANLVATNNLGTESTLDTDSFTIPAIQCWDYQVNAGAFGYSVPECGNPLTVQEYGYRNGQYGSISSTAWVLDNGYTVNDLFYREYEGGCGTYYKIFLILNGAGTPPSVTDLIFGCVNPFGSPSSLTETSSGVWQYEWNILAGSPFNNSGLTDISINY